ILAYSKTDLWNNMDQETNIFLRGLEAVYMNKERNLLHSFIKVNYEIKLRKVSEVKKNYESKTITIEQFQNDSFDLIQSTNFSILHKFSVETINRYHKLIGNK